MVYFIGKPNSYLQGGGKTAELNIDDNGFASLKQGAKLVDIGNVKDLRRQDPSALVHQVRQAIREVNEPVEKLELLKEFEDKYKKGNLGSAAPLDDKPQFISLINDLDFLNDNKIYKNEFPIEDIIIDKYKKLPPNIIKNYPKKDFNFNQVTFDGKPVGETIPYSDDINQLALGLDCLAADLFTKAQLPKRNPPGLNFEELTGTDPTGKTDPALFNQKLLEGLLEANGLKIVTYPIFNNTNPYKIKIQYVVRLESTDPRVRRVQLQGKDALTSPIRAGGDTREEAKANLLKDLEGKTVVLNSGDQDEKKIPVTLEEAATVALQAHFQNINEPIDYTEIFHYELKSPIPRDYFYDESKLPSETFFNDEPKLPPDGK